MIAALLPPAARWRWCRRLAAMLGANVGTALIVQVLSFKLDALAPVLILVGVVAFRRSAHAAAATSGAPASGSG